MDNNEKIIYDDGTHKCVMFSFDDESAEDSFLSVNQYLIIHEDIGILLDPGSESIFDEMYDAVSKHISLDKIEYIFFSHQDPDVAGSIGSWSVTTNAKFVMSSLWVRFMSHYGFMEMNRIVALPDKGSVIKLDEEYIKFLPSHFMHSPGNFSLYDSRSKIVFSGDIGAAILETPESSKSVEDFDVHVEYLQGFHKRYMGSNQLCRRWVKSVEALDVDMIAPQHGFIFEGDKVQNFLDWLKELQCGSDFIDDLYE